MAGWLARAHSDLCDLGSAGWNFNFAYRPTPGKRLMQMSLRPVESYFYCSLWGAEAPCGGRRPHAMPPRQPRDLRSPKRTIEV